MSAPVSNRKLETFNSIALWLGVIMLTGGTVLGVLGQVVDSGVSIPVVSLLPGVRHYPPPLWLIAILIVGILAIVVHLVLDHHLSKPDRL